MLDQKGGSKADTVIKLVFIFFISLLSFSVGTFVGKQVSDSDYRQASLENEFGTGRSTASIDPHHAGEEHEDSLSEKDIADLTDEFINSEKKGIDKEEHKKSDHVKKDHTVAHATKGHSANNGYQQMNKAKDNHHHKAMATTKHDEPTNEQAGHKENSIQHEAQRHVASAADRVAHDKAPTPDIKVKRKPNSVLPSSPTSSIGKYTVQIASYATESEAQNHAGKLKNKGFSAFYIPAKVKGKTWFRVNVGLVANHKSAMVFRKELMQQAGIKSSLIQKIVK